MSSSARCVSRSQEKSRSVGHIVCQSCRCRVNVTRCPTCRRRMSEDGTNSIVNKLIERIQHPCKYKQFGCQVENSLKEILRHEDKCRERTIKCPHLSCKSEVQMRDYHNHASSSSSCNMHPNKRKRSKTFHSCYFQSSKEKGPPFTDIEWKMRAFVDHGERFYLHSHYNHEVETFVFYVTIAVKPRKASKYLAKMTLKNPDDERKSVSITQNVISMASAPRDMKSLLASESALFVSWRAMRGIFVWNEDNEQ